ncbi:MAG TPA: thioesterase family protein [Bacteroidales bacterium]|nr:thioesterase family protein [Bacteroidales bacterium]
MLISTTKRRVIYGETDKMGFLYYGNYPAYYEVGRTEALRELGTSYKHLEDTGIQMPVRNLQVEYLAPARYDEMLTIRTIIREMPGVRMHFEYEVENEAGFLLNRGSTDLVFTRVADNRPVRPPQWFLKLFLPYFGE